MVIGVAHKAAEAALERYFGYPSFRPAQEVPVASLLANEDTALAQKLADFRAKQEQTVLAMELPTE